MTTLGSSGASTLKDTQAAVTAAIAQAKAKVPSPSLGVLFVGGAHSVDLAFRAAKAAAPGCQFVGTQTAGEITERGLTRGGVAVLLLSGDGLMVETAGAVGVKANPANAAKVLCANFGALSERAATAGMTLATSVVLLDTLGGTGEQVVKDVLANTRRFQQIVGGAAGDDGKFQTPGVFGGAVAATDAAVAAHVFHKAAWGVGVDHGLRPMTQPMTVTKAGKATIFELDGRPAFDVYKEFAKQRNVNLTPSTAGNFLISHELGVYFLDELHHARAPVGVGPQGELKLVADVPERAKVCILDGDNDAMIAACTRAAKQAKDAIGGGKAAAVLLFDCVCRGMILGDSFDREVAAVKEVFPGTPIGGFLTYGEIARFRGRLDGWHNTTAVVVAVPEA